MPTIARSLEEETRDEPVGVLPDPFADDEEPVEVDERAWYIIHCYSGYEHKVKHNLEQRIESMGMQEFIFQVVVPTVEEIEIRGWQAPYGGTLSLSGLHYGAGYTHR